MSKPDRSDPVPRDDQRPVTVVTACMTADGLPAFVLNTARVTRDEIANGIHYSLVEADLLLAGFDEPFVHFADDEAPPFLLPAVREHLGLPTDTIIPVPFYVSEDR